MVGFSTLQLKVKNDVPFGIIYLLYYLKCHVTHETVNYMVGRCNDAMHMVGMCTRYDAPSVE